MVFRDGEQISSKHWLLNDLFESLSNIIELHVRILSTLIANEGHGSKLCQMKEACKTRKFKIEILLIECIHILYCKI